ncbi:MAG: PAS domain-containing protein [Deltaproteobacteria bacterium]|nr:PAS domain-containing protein [Deltaproteobacteria bacterium]
MKSGNLLTNRYWTGIPPWVLIGAVLVLLPIFSFMTIENINRQKENSERLLKEKAAALVRSFEAGTRTGMAGRWDGFQLQKLLMETAQQSDIVHLIVTDAGGMIMASSDPEQIGGMHGKDLNLEAIIESSQSFWRILHEHHGKKIFEFYRRFTPTRPSPGFHRGRMKGESPPPLPPVMLLPPDGPDASRIIFIGLDMDSIEVARRSDAMHTVVMGTILLFIGFAGVMMLLLAQNYRMTRASLSRIKAFSDTLVENMPIGLIALDTSLIITSFNHVADRVLNLSAVHASGKKASEVLPRMFLELISHPDIETRAVEKEIVCHIAEKTRLPLQVSAARLQDETGTFLGYVLLFKDLREVQALQKALARSQRLASIGSLAAGVAHEIRNPLSSIKGFATYFRERHSDIPEDREVSSIMIQEVDRLNRVVSQLLAFAKPVTIAKKPVSISDVIRNTLKLMERQSSDCQIDIDTKIQPGLPLIPMDPDQMSQVLLNLLLNSVEAMASGGRIVISATLDQDRLILQISDNGSGIPETDLSQIFDLYFTTKTSGTGLGLAIVHNIVEAHDGDIKVESLAGKGSTVTIRLPFENTRP